MTEQGTLHHGVLQKALTHLSEGRSVDLVGLRASGRSLLLASIARRLGDLHAITVTGHPALRDRPFEALALAGLLPRDVRGAISVTAALAAVEKHVNSPGARRSVVVVDDADQLDIASVGVLAALRARGVTQLLTTSMPVPHERRNGHHLPSQTPPSVAVPVPSLGFVDTQTLITGHLSGPVAPSVIVRLHTACGGLPGLVLATIDTARVAGALARNAGVWVAGRTMYTPEVGPFVEQLFSEVSPGGVHALRTLALAGVVRMEVACDLVGWEALEELDGYGLLRLLPEGDHTSVGVFPPMIAEYFFQTHGSLGRLRAEMEFAGVLAEGCPAGVRPPSYTPDTWDLLDARTASAEPVDHAEVAETVYNRLLLDHWHRRVQVRQERWERDRCAKTAVGYLRALLVTGADPAVGRCVIESTPRRGQPGEVALLDAWHIVFRGLAENDLAGADLAYRSALAEGSEYPALLAAVHEHAVYMLDHATDPCSPPEPGIGAHPDEEDAVAVVRAELAAARGTPALALELLDGVEPSDPDVRRRRDVVWGIATLYEGRIDEAMAHARRHLERAHASLDVDGLQAHAFVITLGLLLSMRWRELREHLGTTLSVGLTPSLERAFEGANISVGAAFALREGRTSTARALVDQARALGLPGGPIPFSNPVWTEARTGSLAAHPLPPNDVAAAERLWLDAEQRVAKGYEMAGTLIGVHAIGQVFDPERALLLRDRVKDLPAGLLRHVEVFIDALCATSLDDAAPSIATLTDAGMTWWAVQAAARWLQGTRLERMYGADAGVVLARLRAIGPDVESVLVPVARRDVLTIREREVAELAAVGMSNQQIANRLRISVRTTENHLHSAFRKLSVTARSALQAALGEEARDVGAAVVSTST